MSPRYKDVNRKQLMGETRQRLVQAAVEEFAREGYEGANINHITQAAGVATGTVYNYFASKNEMMLAILSEIGAAHCAFLTQQIRQTDDIKLRVERLFAAAFDYMKENPHRAKVLFSMLQGTHAAFKVHLNQVYQPMFPLISDEILIPGMQQGIFQRLDPASTTLMIMTFYLGLGLTVDENGETPLNLKEVAAFILRALGVQSVAGE